MSATELRQLARETLAKFLRGEQTTEQGKMIADMAVAILHIPVQPGETPEAA